MKIKACSVCGCDAAKDWLWMNEDWQQFFIGCTNDLCDVMLSIEMTDIDRAKMVKIEQNLIQVWNRIHG